MANIFMSPEEALYAEQQARYNQALQGGATPVGASAQELGRTIAGAFGSAFGAPPQESPLVQQARVRQGVVKGIKPTDINSYLQGAESAYQAGQYDLANDLLGKYVSLTSAFQKEGAYKPGELKEVKVGDQIVTAKYTPGASVAGFIPDWVPYVSGYKTPDTVITSEKEATKYSFDELKTANEEAKAGQQMKDAVTMFDNMMSDIETGALTKFKVNAAKYAASAGLPVPGDVSTIAAAQKLSSQMTLSAMQKLKGAISNYEWPKLEESVLQITDPKEARAMGSKLLKAAADRSVRYRSEMAKFMSKNNNNLMPPGKESFYEYWDNWLKDNPILAEVGVKTKTPRKESQLMQGIPDMTKMTDEELRALVGQ